MKDESASAAISPSNSNVAVLSDVAEKTVKNPELLARLVLREGKPFKSSAVTCGYSLAVACKGYAWLCRVSKDVADAYSAENYRLSTSMERLKPLAIKRLYDEIANPKSSLGIKAIELAGRFKETDWFVRNAEVQIGIFGSLAGPDPAADAIDADKEEE